MKLFRNIQKNARGFSLHASIAASSMALAIGMVGFFSFAQIQAQNIEHQVSLVSCAYIPPPPNIVGNAAYILDLSTDESLFEKNAFAQLPLASVTKIMTGIVVVDTLPEDATISIPLEAFSVEGSQQLTAWERWKVSDLLNFMLVTSSNHAARALALTVNEYTQDTPDGFIRRMNEKAEHAGLVSMYFLNETGLDASEGVAGAYGSARDVAYLFALAAREYPSVAAASTDARRTVTTESGLARVAEHTSALASALPGTIVIKTGYTDLAGGNLAVIIEPVPGRPVAIVVLASTREDRHTDVLSLATYAQRLLRIKTLCGT